ncbi:DUF998 domain-containing protein [Streptomyces albus]
MRIGYCAWVVGVVQFFVLHLVVQTAWERPYSWARNNISDLGNAHCVLQPDPEPRYVCSPGHGLMNVSFVTLGVLLAVGAVLAGGALWRRGGRAVAARLLLAGGGLGFVLAGLAPADIDENVHMLGALLVMGVGNIGLLLASWAPAERLAGWARRAAGLAGAVAVVAFGLFLSGHYLGLGMGGMERAAAFPPLLWALAVGLAGLLGGLRGEAGPRRATRAVQGTRAFQG